MTHQIWFTVASFHIVALLLFASMFIVSRRPEMLYYLLAVVLGMVTGFIDLNNNDVQVTVLLLLVFGYFLGFAHSRNAWRIGILLGLWIPLFGIVHVMAFGRPDQMAPQGLGSLISLVPSFGGVYLGSMVRRISDRRARGSARSGPQ